MITYFTANYENDILWQLNWIMGERFQVSAMLHKVWDKKRNIKIAETPKMIGKVGTGTINRERRKTMIVVLEVEVTTNITHI